MLQFIVKNCQKDQLQNTDMIHDTIEIIEAIICHPFRFTLPLSAIKKMAMPFREGRG